ncbi:MAG: ACT domain-containing protein [Ruminococcaceae bacterium]|nr:ACT domain-containing protein [Oscillospiraceae bacterium]
MIIKQLSVFVENKPGRLAEITKIISNAGCSMEALSIADTDNFGILRLIVDDHEKALSALKENNVIASVKDVVSVKVPDVPGGFSGMLNCLSEKGIDVSYTYAFISKSENFAQVVIRVADNEKAISILKEAGYKL